MLLAPSFNIMTWYILIPIILFLLILAICITYSLTIRKVKEINNDNAKQYEQALKDLQDVILHRNNVAGEAADFQTECNKLLIQKNELYNEVEEMKRSAKDKATQYYEEQLNAIEKLLVHDKQQAEIKYQDAEQECQDTYLDLMNDLAKETTQLISKMNQQIMEKQTELEQITNELDDYTKKVSAAVAANKREEEKREKEKFYRLDISSADLLEIEELRECSSRLRNPLPLNKAIWKMYYENAYTAMVGRVVGSGVHTGIYKITNIKNQMCYVGQAVDIADRWRQHIKKGVGADTPTKNKLYPAMAEFGVENFTFEIIEECDRTKLDSREDYWQQYFKAMEFGYSIK